MAVRSNGRDINFGYVCSVTLTFEIWPWVKVMTHSWIMDNKWTLGSWTTIVWNIIQIQHSSEKFCPDTYFGYVCTVTLTSETLGQAHDTPFGHGQWLIIKIQLWNVELQPRHRFSVYEHLDIDLGDMTLGQGLDTPFGHGQQLCEIISGPSMAVRSYGLDTDFGYVCNVTLTFKIWPWVEVMTHPLVMDNKCVIYYLDPIWQWEVMARIQNFGICALLPWPWRYDLRSRSWHTFRLWTTIVWNIIQIQQGSEE